MDKRIDHKNIQEKWQKIWVQTHAFESRPDERKKISLVLPPPNVTGKLHMGHALNSVFQDTLARYYRQKGYNVMWVVGLDSAGIATQSKIEKELLAVGINKNDLSREEFIKKIYEWKDKYGSIIINQLKSLGCSCDWSKERFTMDHNFSKLVTDIFIQLYNASLIYQDNYIINWCTSLQTAISDEEVESKPIKSKLYYLKYYLNDTDYVTVATSRPETIFGDTAVCFNTTDERYINLNNKFVKVPLIGKKVPIISDESVVKDFGTGLVKITPCHDKLDFEIGKRHNIEFIPIINKEGKLYNIDHKEYQYFNTMPVDVARRIIIKELTKNNLIEKIEEYETIQKICYRTGSIIEPLVTKQWFLKMKELSQTAKNMVDDNQVEILPKKNIGKFYNWVNNIRDWCISRQLVWGHRIPIYYCHLGHINCWDSNKNRCDLCDSTDLHQDPDVLDTWFSSWLWSFGVFQENELEYYYPLDFLITGEDILFFWVIKMMMASGYFKKQIPFKKVYLHGIVRDENNKKMSKSSGNTIDPLDLIEKFGIDPVRFTLLINTPFDSDPCISENNFNIGKTFCTKLWNIVRFFLDKVQGNLIELHEADLNQNDIQIINKHNILIDNIDKYIKNFEFSKMTKDIYQFVWNDFANEYLEFVKNENYVADIKFTIFYRLITNIIKILHPLIPHITEELNYLINKNDTSIMLQDYQHITFI